MRLSTAEKLQRLISIVAWINGQEEGATLDEVCTRFDISRGELVAQLVRPAKRPGDASVASTGVAQRYSQHGVSDGKIRVERRRLLEELDRTDVVATEVRLQPFPLFSERGQRCGGMALRWLARGDRRH